MAELWLLCEGVSDLPVLSAVLTEVLAADISVRASGGSRNAPAAAAYARSQRAGSCVAYIVDRDYRSRAAADATFLDGTPGFMWRRHAIESYLIAPAVILAAFRGLRASVAENPGGAPGWVLALPDDEAAVGEGLRACARKRAPTEALRFAVHRLWEALADSAGAVQKRVPAVPGGPNPDAEGCRRALLDEVARLVDRARDTAEAPELSAVSAGERYDEELERVRGSDYVGEMGFIEEFHGRELLGEFWGWLRQKFGFRRSRAGFVEDLIKAVPGAYQANRRLYGTDDFLDLANGVRALAGAPALAASG